jgi:hypothetical protein
VRKFAETVIKVLGTEYLRAPNAKDTTRLLAVAKAGGWPGMLGSIDRLTVYTGDGRTTQRHGMGNTPDMSVIKQSYLKLLPPRTCGFGYLTITLTSMS